MTLRGEATLLTAELVLVLVCAGVALPLPAQVPLLVLASVSLAMRKQSWGDRFTFDAVRLGVGAAMGAAALGLALALTPLVEGQTGGMVQWGSAAAVRGKPEMFLTFTLVTVVMAVATEMVLRGWILERVHEQVRGRAAGVVAITVAAIVEAMFTAAAGTPAVGSFLVGAALGAVYLAGGRSLVAPVAARVVFEVGVLFLQAAKLVG